MTQDEVIELACQTFGGVIKKEERDNFIAFAKLVAEKEREACAKVCDDKVDAEYATGKVDHNEMGWTQSCAIAIRARGEA